MITPDNTTVQKVTRKWWCFCCRFSLLFFFIPQKSFATPKHTHIDPRSHQEMIFANVLKVLYYFHFGNGNIVVLKSYGRISYENAFWREKKFFFVRHRNVNYVWRYVVCHSHYSTTHIAYNRVSVTKVVERRQGPEIFVVKVKYNESVFFLRLLWHNSDSIFGLIYPWLDMRNSTQRRTLYI